MAEGDDAMPQAFIHAFEKLDFLVTEGNAHLFSAEDLEAWRAAVEEGEQLYGPVDEGRS